MVSSIHGMDDASFEQRRADSAAAVHRTRTLGIPVTTPEGEVLGRLCHYGLVPRDPEKLDLELRVRVASAIEQSRQIPSYPRS